MSRFAALLLLTLLLPACGQSGDLYRPEDQPPQQAETTAQDAPEADGDAATEEDN